ncbi:MAG TPA: hypothetical protein VGD78_00935 [Chthoniobacterales bacterium]
MSIPALSPYPAPVGRAHHPTSSAALLIPLKSRLQRRLASCYDHVIPATAVARAVEQAALLAATTEFPTLFFPVLAEETVRAAALSASPDVLPFNCAEAWATPSLRQPLQNSFNP